MLYDCPAILQRLLWAFWLKQEPETNVLPQKKGQGKFLQSAAGLNCLHWPAGLVSLLLWLAGLPQKDDQLYERALAWQLEMTNARCHTFAFLKYSTIVFLVIQTKKKVWKCGHWSHPGTLGRQVWLQIKVCDWSIKAVRCDDDDSQSGPVRPIWWQWEWQWQLQKLW